MNGQPNPITRKRVYELIYKTQRISKQDIAYQLTLSLPTVSQQLQSLEASGLIERNGSFASTGGRKAQIISCIYDARISIGIEIRLHTLSMAAIDLRGTLLHTIQYAVPFSNTLDYFELLGEKLTRTAGTDLCGWKNSYLWKNPKLYRSDRKFHFQISSLSLHNDP